MSASVSTAQNPPIAASTNATAATASSAGSSANVAAGSAQPTARSYASATKKVSSPPIASSAAPPVAVGGPQTPQHGRSSSISPAVPNMAPTIVSSVNGAPSHDRKASLTINGGGPVPRAPSGLTFGSMAGSPAPAHSTPVPHSQTANLYPQAPNPRVTSPAHSPSPIPQIPQYSGGAAKPSNLPGRPDISFGGEGADNRPPQPIPQAQHLRRESSQSAHSDMSNPTFNQNRPFVPNGGRGRGGFNPAYNQQQMGHSSPQPYRAMPNQPRGGQNMAPPFQPQRPGGPNSPFLANRSPAPQPAALHQQQYPNGPMYPGYPPQYQQPHQNMYGVPPGQAGLDPYAGYYGSQFGLQQSMYAPHPASPGRGHGFPQQMQGYGQPYGQPPQATGMSRTPSNMSERPPSAVGPTTPAMTNVSHVTHTQTPSVGSNNNSPAPASSNFTIPPKKQSKAILIKNPDGEVLTFDTKKAASPAPPKSPMIVSTPTPPPRAPSAAESSHSRTESIVTKSDKEKQAEFVKQFQQNLKLDKEKEEKEEADRKAAEEKEAKAKAEAEAEAKAFKEKEEAEAKAAQEAKEREEAEAEKKRLEDEEEERLIREMEEMERLEEERERAYQEKKKKENEAKKAAEAERIKEEEAKLRQQEREAEERELAREKERESGTSENAELFASLKKNTMFGPGAATNTDSGASTPPAESTASTPVQTLQPKITSATKPKPAALKLETAHGKQVEPAQPTAGMQSLKSARFLQVREELAYPDGFKSPNPALNPSNKARSRTYDKDFLLQFQDVFKEKPSMDWDLKLKETVGDGSDSARPQSARPSTMGMGPRQNSSRASLPGGPMGNFGQFGGGSAPRTLPPGTTSEQRFREASRAGPTMTNPLAGFMSGNRNASFPVPAQMTRTSSFQNMAPNSPRVGSQRGGQNSRRGNKGPNKDSGAKEANMPLTQGMDLKPLEKSQTGWKPHSQTQAPLPSGHMAPDMVQRKVKAALNKMTPEKFDKIADQILDIAAQSKDESDGRTLRQVIQLTFEKACDEAHWASMYAKFCHRMLTTMSPEIKDENVKDKHGQLISGGSLFRKYLLNRCQEEFERGWSVNLPEKPEGQTEEAALLSDDYYIAAAAKRKGLGLIQFIGELYKLGMLTLRIMHECVLKLLDFEGLPDESAIESLTKLLRTVGYTMEQNDTGPKMIAVYFERVEKIISMDGLPSRLRFMLMDVVDLRRQGWQGKDTNKGPKTIAEIHQEAAAAQQAAEMERTRSNQRGGPRPPIGRGDARSFSGGMMPPPDYPSGRVQMDDLRKLSKGASGRNVNNPSQLGPSMLGSRSNSGRRGLGPGGLMGRGDESGGSSRTTTPPVQKEKDKTTSVNSFSALLNLESNEGAGDVGSPPSTTSSPPAQKSIPARSKSPAVEAKDA